MTWRIGVDIGGTFTDVVLADETTGAASVVKVSTTPRDFAQGVMDGLRAAMHARGEISDAQADAATIIDNSIFLRVSV